MTEQTQPATPVPAPAPQPKSTKLPGVNVNSLGFFLDGWADLVEGKGAKATEVKANVYKYLKERNMPDIEVKQVDGSTGIGTGKRPYNITMTYPSATTAIYVGEHGQDLYVSWRTFIKPQLGSALVLITVISLLAGFLPALSLYSSQSDNLLPLLLGQGSPSAAFGVFFTSFILTFTFLSFLVAVLGSITKGDFRALFYVEPNVFDAEDITAMSLSVHKSIIRSLDSTGDIDISKLRLKETFKGGRTGQVV